MGIDKKEKLGEFRGRDGGPTSTVNVQPPNLGTLSTHWDWPLSTSVAGIASDGA